MGLLSSDYRGVLRHLLVLPATLIFPVYKLLIRVLYISHRFAFSPLTSRSSMDTLDQHCPVGFSGIMEMSFIYAVVVSWGCCNKLSPTKGLTTTETRSLAVGRVLPSAGSEGHSVSGHCPASGAARNL